MLVPHQCSPRTSYTKQKQVSTYAKATKAELARNYDEAFKLYVQATESFLHLSRTTHHSEALHAKWKASASKALQRAEKIKAFAQKTQEKQKIAGDVVLSPVSGGTSTNKTADVRLTPIGINHFSSQEQFYVLERGSRINGLTFSLWDRPMPLSPSSSPFMDPDGQPPLSAEQQRVSASWRRSAQAGHDVVGRRKLLPQEILQHIVTDCSVCASISVCLEHARRFESDLARSALHSASGITISLEDKAAALSLAHGQGAGKNGRYDVKMFVNGSWRRVLIDDALPYNPSDGSFMCMTVNSETGFGEAVYWPSLIEKSYMKLMGGYDFPGSNSSIDLHAITGWIPEQIDTKSSAFERERTWERLITGFKRGQCVVTLGTGPRHGIQWRETPLLGSHSYAVIDIAENQEDRLFTVLDSWVRPEDEQCSRTMRIPWSEVVYVFDGIYLSWDPTMWARRIDFHGMWKRGSQDDEVDANHNLRVNFVNANAHGEEEIWILLTRHIRDTRRTDDFICLRAELEHPVLPPSARLHQQQVSNIGTYTNSTHILVRTRIPSSYRSGTVAVMASYEGDKAAKEIGFSVCVYSGASLQITWDESVSPPPYSTKVEGTLTSKNSGGNCTYPTFMVNPEYHLRIHSPTKAVAGKESRKSLTKVLVRAGKDTPVNIVAVWSKGDRKSELVEQEVAASSGAYTYGLAQAVKNLMPGDYTLIVSAFEPHHTGPYTLKVECSTPFDLKSIPQEGAGMYTKVVRGAWEENTAAGGPTFQKYARNPRFEFVLPVSGQIKIRLQLLDSSKISSAALNVAVFYSTSSTSDSSSSKSISPPRANAGPVATSGAHSEALAGVVTPLVTLAKGAYEIVPSIYSPGVQAEFRLVMYLSVSGVDVKRVH
ncbi:cysteine proteinase [Macrolepiota fuliginosa MF-IS2]|uniref:Cysteine proteinase n=1 Tax=Macrolepiota fuliginosa MF-IS2 TaxID=1400762 RepID=A0A9P5XNL7_9AGAR|nr:cysteine proteinase [Macrolepiota fuliginosa MF-IS2]